MKRLVGVANIRNGTYDPRDRESHQMERLSAGRAQRLKVIDNYYGKGTSYLDITQANPPGQGMGSESQPAIDARMAQGGVKEGYLSYAGPDAKRHWLRQGYKEFPKGAKRKELFGEANVSRSLMYKLFTDSIKETTPFNDVKEYTPDKFDWTWFDENDPAGRMQLTEANPDEIAAFRAARAAQLEEKLKDPESEEAKWDTEFKKLTTKVSKKKKVKSEISPAAQIMMMAISSGAIPTDEDMAAAEKKKLAYLAARELGEVYNGEQPDSQATKENTEGLRVRTQAQGRTFHRTDEETFDPGAPSAGISTTEEVQPGSIGEAVGVGSVKQSSPDSYSIAESLVKNAIPKKSVLPPGVTIAGYNRDGLPLFTKDGVLINPGGTKVDFDTRGMVDAGEEGEGGTVQTTEISSITGVTSKPMAARKAGAKMTSAVSQALTEVEISTKLAMQSQKAMASADKQAYLLMDAVQKFADARLKQVQVLNGTESAIEKLYTATGGDREKAKIAAPHFESYDKSPGYLDMIKRIGEIKTKLAIPEQITKMMTDEEGQLMEPMSAREELMRQFWQSKGLMGPDETQKPSDWWKSRKFGEQRAAARNRGSDQWGHTQYGTNVWLAGEEGIKSDVSMAGVEAEASAEADRTRSQFGGKLTTPELQKKFSEMLTRALANQYKQKAKIAGLLTQLPPVSEEETQRRNAAIVSGPVETPEEEQPEKKGWWSRILSSVIGHRKPGDKVGPEPLQKYVRDVIGYQMKWKEIGTGKNATRTQVKEERYGKFRLQTPEERAAESGIDVPKVDRGSGLLGIFSRLFDRKKGDQEGEGGGDGEGGKAAGAGGSKLGIGLFMLSYRMMQLNRIIWQMASSTIKSLIDVMMQWEGQLNAAAEAIGLQGAINPDTGKPFGGGPDSGGMTGEEKRGILADFPAAAMEVQAAMGNITLAMMGIAINVGPQLVIVINAIAEALRGPLGAFITSFVGFLAGAAPVFLGILKSLEPLMPALGWLFGLLATFAPIIAAVGWVIAQVIGLHAGIAGFVGFITMVLVPAITGLAIVIGAPLWAIIVVITAIIAALVLIATNFETFKNSINGVLTWLGGWIDTIKGWIGLGGNAPNPTPNPSSNSTGQENMGYRTQQTQTVYQTINIGDVSSDVDLAKVYSAASQGSQDSMYRTSMGVTSV